ncbi:MAG: hypothetical protein ABIN61_04010 [candidate division WOR-3 bacterium]
MIILLFFSSILEEISEKLKEVRAIECNFTEILIVKGDTLKFRGSVYAEKKRARIDVYKPERQIMIFINDSIFLWTEKTNQVFRRKAPIIFYNVLFSPNLNYKIDSTSSGWIYLSPLKDELIYPISVLLNKDLLPKKIRFAQEEGSGVFTFSSYKLNKKYPEGFFSLDKMN